MATVQAFTRFSVAYFFGRQQTIDVPTHSKRQGSFIDRLLIFHKWTRLVTLSHTKSAFLSSWL